MVPVLRDLPAAPVGSTGQNPSGSREARFPLFGMPTGFIQDPVGLDTDDDSPLDDSNSPTSSEGDNRLEVALGDDNPFFDIRRPGDPGGVGYFRMHSQFQLADTGTTSVSLALRAVTPAGLESNGVASGPTFVSPALALYHQLDPSGLAVHGFLGNNMRATAHLGDSFDNTLKYGFALQSPLAGGPNGSGQSLHMFVEALGRYSLDTETSSDPRTGSTLELVPGLHWRLGDSGWLSGGVIVPLGTAHVPANLWQITWSWRF